MYNFLNIFSQTEVHNSVSELYQNLKQCVKQKQERQKPAVLEKEKTHIDWEPVEITDKSLKSVERMIQSMREQIGLLEERIDECKFYFTLTKCGNFTVTYK